MEVEIKSSFANNYPRIFIDINDLANLKSISIEASKLHYSQNWHHYLTKVLRLKTNDKFIIANNTENIFLVEIQNLTKETINCKFLDQETGKDFCTTKIELLQGVPKSDKLETITQKTTELGVHIISPLMSQHSIKKLKEKHIDRLQTIACEASRQSRRSYLPRINNVDSVMNFLAKTEMTNARKLLFDATASNDLKTTLKEDPPPMVYLAVGPEGDFSKQEKELFIEKGFEKISLGSTILRTETAAIFSVGLIRYELESLSRK